MIYIHIEDNTPTHLHCLQNRSRLNRYVCHQSFDDYEDLTADQFSNTNGRSGALRSRPHEHEMRDTWMLAVIGVGIGTCLERDTISARIGIGITA